MSRPRLLDLYCGAGGCSVGYAKAGFDVVGVDIANQPNYPYTFIRGDALEALDQDLSGFDAIHASPPCQAYTTANEAAKAMGKKYPDLLAATIAAIRKTDMPYIVENVEGARKHLECPVKLCGSMFGLLVRRHRYFECNFPVPQPRCHHELWSSKVFPTTSGAARKRSGQAKLSGVVQVAGNSGDKGGQVWPTAMGIGWMTRKELTQAIPPAYTAYLAPFLRHAIDQAHARSPAGS